MKRLISILLTVCMCFSIGMVLTACGDNESHEHTYKTEWAYDDMHHWHACEGEDCTEMYDKAEHTWNDGEITTEATAEADGVKTFTCTVCGKTKTKALEYVVTNVDKSGYSFFNEEDHYCIIKRNQIGLPVEVYSESAFAGERDEGDRDLEYSIEYTSDNLISSIVSPYRYYEFEYNNDYTYAYGVAYETNTAKKVEDGRTIVISYSEKKQIETINAYSANGLLSQYVFNEKGQVIRFIEQDEVSLYQYDEYDRLIVCEMLELSDSGSIASEVLSLSYNDDATLPSGYEWSEDGIVCWKGTDITYDRNGQLLTSSCTYYDGSEIDGALTCISCFDEAGRLINYREMWQSGEDEGGVYTELTYNSNGLLNDETRFDIDGDTKLLSSKNVYEYDNDGNCISETYSYYAADGITVESTSTTTYTYNENDQLTSEIRGNGEGNRYTYDSNGLMISEVYVFEDGTESDPVAYQWIFDDNGRLLERPGQKFTYGEDGKKMSYFEAENNYGAGKSYTFAYDAFGRVIKINIVVKATEWNSELQMVEVYTAATGESTYVYAESGDLISASLYEWDYDIGEYVNNTYNYVAAE